MIATCYVISTPIAPLGHPAAGGLNLMVHNLSLALLPIADSICVVAPQGSKLSFLHPKISLVEIVGSPHLPTQYFDSPHIVSFPSDSSLAEMLGKVFDDAQSKDIVINLAHDWLAFYLTPFFTRSPLLHYINNTITAAGMGRIIADIAARYPNRVAMMSKSQMTVFNKNASAFHLPMGIDVDRYLFNAQSKPLLGWAGRIVPEKDIAKAMMIADALDMPLRVMGEVIDQPYWDSCRAAYPDVHLEITGFLDTDALQVALGECAAFLMTSRWKETFGMVVLEALACGVPVICHDDDGPSEIVLEGKTGYHVPRHQDKEWINQTKKALNINRATCREHIESYYTLARFEKTFQQWVQSALKDFTLHDKPR